MGLGDDTSRNVIGLSVFLLGLILLIFTFYTAYSVFTNPSTLEGLSKLVPETGGENDALGSIMNIAVYGIGGLLLWVMGSVSGRIAKHGIKIYISTPSDEK